MSLVTVQDHAAVRTITLDRPGARNALSRALRADLADAVTAAAVDQTVQVIVLTGADPAFCAGLDLKELSTSGFDGGRGGEPSTHTGGGDPFRALHDCPKPIIGAINGAAITGGLEIALLCDWRVASERAVFVDTHGPVGVVPGGGLTARLPAAVGLARAKQMSLTSEPVDAELALRWGLVNEVVPHDQLLERAEAQAARVTAMTPAMSQRMVTLYDEVQSVAFGEGLSLERSINRDWVAPASEVATNVAAVFERGRGDHGSNPTSGDSFDA